MSTVLPLAVIPTAVLGLQVSKGAVLPATGVAIGMYVAVALTCIIAGALMRLWTRHAIKSN